MRLRLSRSGDRDNRYLAFITETLHFYDFLPTGRLVIFLVEATSSLILQFKGSRTSFECADSAFYIEYLPLSFNSCRLLLHNFVHDFVIILSNLNIFVVVYYAY